MLRRTDDRGNRLHRPIHTRPRPGNDQSRCGNKRRPAGSRVKPEKAQSQRRTAEELQKRLWDPDADRGHRRLASENSPTRLQPGPHRRDAASRVPLPSHSGKRTCPVRREKSGRHPHEAFTKCFPFIVALLSLTWRTCLTHGHGLPPGLFLETGETMLGRLTNSGVSQHVIEK